MLDNMTDCKKDYEPLITSLKSLHGMTVSTGQGDAFIPTVAASPEHCTLHSGTAAIPASHPRVCSHSCATGWFTMGGRC